MCSVWITEQTAIIYLYSINWLVFYNRDGVCLLRDTDWILKHHGGPGSIPGQPIWDLWWTKLHRDRFFSQYFSFLSVSFHQCSILIHSIYIIFFSQYFSFPLSVSFRQCSMLVSIVPGHTGYTLEHSKKQYAVSEIGEDCIQKVVSLSL